MSYFLLVYDRRQRRLLSEQRFDDHGQALAGRFTEERQRADEDGVEVVVIGAASHEELERTHGRYFRSSSELMADLGTSFGS